VPGGHSSPMGRLLDVAYNQEYGAETTDQSALNIIYLLQFQPKPGNFSIYGASDERYHIVGGNQRPLWNAGEHCSQDFQGYMEGGASEGIRAANEIVSALKK